MENETELEQELETTPEEESTEEVSEDKDLKAEVAKYKAIAERKSKQLNAIKDGLGEEEDNKVKETPIPEAARLERLELKVDGYSDKEIDFILKNGGKDAISDDMVKGAIEADRAKAKSEGATPEGGAKSPIFKRYTQSDIDKMPLEELEKIVPTE